MHNYNNTIVIYDEIVEALKSIIECSIDSEESNINYLDSKYESVNNNIMDNKSEKLLYNAIKTLEKNIDSASKVIRTGLQRELKGLNDNIINIDTDYLIGQEKRKLSAQKSSIQKIMDNSLNMDILYTVPLYSEDSYDTALESLDNIDTNKVFSEFEKKVIADFPGFFKEEMTLANQTDDDSNIVDINNLSSHEYVPAENVEHNEEKFDNDKLRLIKGAIKKAIKLGDMKLVVELENKYFEELSKK